MKLFVTTAVFAMALLALVAADSASAAFPGRNGLIVFASTTGENITPQLFSIEPGGTGRDNLTLNLASNHSGVWSPDGRHIAFCELDATGSTLMVMKADGTEQRRLDELEQLSVLRDSLSLVARFVARVASAQSARYASRARAHWRTPV